MRIIPTAQHESNKDTTARIVREDRGRWTIYGVKGGFVATLPPLGLKAIAGIFSSEREAIEAAESALRA